MTSQIGLSITDRVNQIALVADTTYREPGEQTMDKVVGAVKRFREDMAEAGIFVSGFELLSEHEAGKLAALAAQHILVRKDGTGKPEIFGMEIFVRGKRT